MQFYLNLKKEVNSSKSYEYTIEFDGSYLEKNKELKIDEAEIADNDLLIVETKQNYYKERWVFTNNDVPIEGNCEYCRQNEILTIKCICKKVGHLRWHDL